MEWLLGASLLANLIFIILAAKPKVTAIIQRLEEQTTIKMPTAEEELRFQLTAAKNRENYCYLLLRHAANGGKIKAETSQITFPNSPATFQQTKYYIDTTTEVIIPGLQPVQVVGLGDRNIEIGD